MFPPDTPLCGVIPFTVAGTATAEILNSVPATTEATDVEGIAPSQMVISAGLLFVEVGIGFTLIVTVILSP